MDSDECPTCGEAVDVPSWEDGTPVCCPDCGRRGWVSGDAESEAYIQWEDGAS